MAKGKKTGSKKDMENVDEFLIEDEDEGTIKVEKDIWEREEDADGEKGTGDPVGGLPSDEEELDYDPFDELDSEDPDYDLTRGSRGHELDEEEIKRLLWDADDNPWKKETLRIKEDKRYLENEVLRLQNKVMFLNGELNKMKSPPLIVGSVVDFFGDDMVIVSTSGGPSFVVRLSSSVERSDIDIGTKVSLNKDSMSVTGILPSSKDPLVGAAEIVERPTIGFEDVGGLDEQIGELKEVVELPLTRPELFRTVGIEPPKGVLLVGPPGCGKTLVAKAIANATRATFLRMVGSELVQKYIGEGSRMVRELFQLAKERSPSIIFLDELDSIAGRRVDSNTSADREVQRTLIQLLAELDGFDPLGDVRIIAATNRPDILDPAILRPGRIDRVIEIPLPDMDSRVKIFRVHSKGMNLDSKVDLEDLARRSKGMNGSQIKAICTEAGMYAIREGRKRVTTDDLDRAIVKVRESGEDGSLLTLGRSSGSDDRAPMFV